MSVETCSGAIFASLHTGETANHACQHFLQAFTFLGAPQEIKTNNGHIQLKNYSHFKWIGVFAILLVFHTLPRVNIERTQQTLKCILDKQKGGVTQATP